TGSALVAQAVNPGHGIEGYGTKCLSSDRSEEANGAIEEKEREEQSLPSEKEFEEGGGADGSVWKIVEKGRGVENADENDFEEGADAGGADQMCICFVSKSAAILLWQKRKRKCEKEIHCWENDTLLGKWKTVVLRPAETMLAFIKNGQVNKPEQSQHGAQIQQTQGILTLPVWKRVLRCEGRQNSIEMRGSHSFSAYVF